MMCSHLSTVEGLCEDMTTNTIYPFQCKTPGPRSDGEMASPYTHKQLRTYEPSENGTNFMARPPFSLLLSLVTRLIKLLFISPIN